MKNRIIIISVVVAIVAAMGFTLFKNKKKIEKNNQVVDRSNIKIPVTVINAESLPVNGNLELPAVLEPENEVTISVNAQGKLQNLHIDLGTVVSKGQVLGTVDTKLKELNLQSTELTMNKQQSDYERNADLLKGNAISEQNVKDSKYQYENTKIQVEQLKTQINDSRVVSPISGVIIKKSVEEGEFVNPGTPIATVVNVSQLKAKVMVNEKEAYRVVNGQEVSITCDVYPGREFTGKVRYISPAGDENHNYEVEIVITNTADLKLKAGTFIRVNLGRGGSEECLQVPKTALAEGIKNPYVYIIQDGKAVTRKISIGREIGENIEVLSGLEKGEAVIVSGQINLIDGSLVEVMNEK